MDSLVNTILAVVGALGGIETIKYFLNRRANKRKEEAEADKSEFEVLRSTNEFLQKSLDDKEHRFVEQTARLREAVDKTFSLQEELSKLKLAHQMKRCDKLKCEVRVPPNGLVNASLKEIQEVEKENEEEIDGVANEPSKDENSSLVDDKIE